MSWLHGAATRFKLLFAPRATEQRIDKELDFHISMETERLVRELGLDNDEARRRALATFGGEQQHREALRRGRGTAWLSAVSLDTKLGLRMLAKYPGLTIVGVLAVSVAVAVGTLGFIAMVALTSPKLPLDEGDRVVAISNRDIEQSVDVKATHLHSLEVWRGLRTVTDIGAWRLAQRSVIANGHAARSLPSAEMTASAFRLARVSPVQGRTFTAEDEREGGPDVVVIGYELWQQLFDGRADVLGSTVRLGVTPHTVIGVMPAGFAFPLNNQLWTPLRLNPSAYEAGRAPSINVFGRLAQGASLESAQREMATVAPRISEGLASRAEFIRTTVTPYTQTFFNGTIDGMGYGSIAQRAQVILILLLIVITTNVAVLVYARTASRAGEIAVRTALGASRSRIVAQLFMEALVLSVVASIAGLAIAQLAGKRAAGVLQLAFGNLMPYWIRLEVTPGVALYVAGLAVFVAIIIGAVPGLKATRNRVSLTLKESSGNASMRLGGTWTTLLVAQVAISVAVLPIAQLGTRAFFDLAFTDLASPVTTNTVIAQAELDQDADAFSFSAGVRQIRRARYTSTIDELTRRLEVGSGVYVMQMASSPDDQQYMQIEVDTLQTPDTLWTRGPTVERANVEPDFFDVFDIRLLAGRSFNEGDAKPGTNNIIVTRAFANRFFENGNALGKRVRRFSGNLTDGVRKEADAPWWEVVGIVDDYPKIPTHNPYPKVYFPLRVAETYPIVLAVHAPGTPPAAVAERVRTTALDVDPTLRFGAIKSIEDRMEDGLEAEKLGILGLVLVTVSVVLLSTAGIYALMSFTVTRRRREIGIRSALGAGSGRVLAGILKRALWQIGTGVAIGVVGAPIIATVAGNSSTTRELVEGALVLIATMVIVGLLATVGPARRALRVHPTEALRAE